MKISGLGLVLFAAFTLSSCCAVVPIPEKYFDQRTPFDALRAFAYSVETEQWEGAYKCLSAADRKDITSPFFLSLGIEHTGHPKYGIPIEDLIVGAEWYRDSVREPTIDARTGAQTAEAFVRYQGETDEGIPIDLWLTLDFVREKIDDSKPLWRIDFHTTLLKNAPQH